MFFVPVPHVFSSCVVKAVGERPLYVFAKIHKTDRLAKQKAQSFAVAAATPAKVFRGVLRPLSQPPDFQCVAIDRLLPCVLWSFAARKLVFYLIIYKVWHGFRRARARVRMPPRPFAGILARAACAAVARRGAGVGAAAGLAACVAPLVLP